MHLPLQTPLLHLCTVACGRIAPCGKKCGPGTVVPRGAGGFTTSPCHHLNARRWSRVFDFGSGEISRPRYGYLSRYAVASTRRVAESSYACGGGRRSRCARRARKYAYFHTQKSEPQPATAHRLPALVGTLSSAKSEELRARAITNLPKSSEYRRAGYMCGFIMWERVGRPVPVF